MSKLPSLSQSAKERLLNKALDAHDQKKQKQETLPPNSTVRGLFGRKFNDKLCRFDQFDGYKEIQYIELGGKSLGVSSPFFKKHDGIAGAVSLINGQEFINFSSYNYLGLGGHPDVTNAAKNAIDQYGTTVSASRMVSGEREVQQQLEKKIAELYSADDALVFVSGHATNVSTIGYLFGPKDLILHDALAHNSILQGTQLSGATRLSFKHNDWEHLEDILGRQRKDFERVLIVIEGLYSMDGDIPDLQKFISIKKAFKAFLMVDEAHSIGVLGSQGKGISEHCEINPHDIDIWMGTLSKSFASCGGYIAGESALIKHLRHYAPGFLYSVGISPCLAAAAISAIEVMQNEPSRVTLLKERGHYFLRKAQEAGIDTGKSAGFSVIPAMAGSSKNAVVLSNKLFERGINVQPILRPAVEDKAARLRFFMSSEHTENQIDFTIDSLASALEEI